MKDIGRLFDSSNISQEISGNNRQDVQDFIDGIGPDLQGNIQICTIIDYYCDNLGEAKKMCDTLMTVINEPESRFPSAKFSYDYDAGEGKARFTLFGTPEYISKTIELLK